MQQLIADITTYNKTRQMDVSYEDTDMMRLLTKVTEDMADDITDAGGTVQFADLPKITGVQFLLTQLFMNLFRNSLKFAKKDVPLKIIISYEGMTAGSVSGRSYHHITVTDNGIGFDNKYNEQIFKVFSRLHTSAQFEGSGIGLALCRKIMHNYKGFISAEGEVGTGAKFTLLFPEK